MDMDLSLNKYLERQSEVKILKEQVYALTIQLKHERCIRYYLEGYRNKHLAKVTGYSTTLCNHIVAEYKKALSK